MTELFCWGLLIGGIFGMCLGILVWSLMAIAARSDYRDW